MAFIDVTDLHEKEIMSGFHGRIIHTENMTFVYWDIDAGATLPEHAHPHEQVINMIEGELEINAGGEVRRMKSGQVAVIAGNVLHSGKAITACRVIDVFCPVREDYR